jgi:TPR repeat protein
MRLLSINPNLATVCRWSFAWRATILLLLVFTPSARGQSGTVAGSSPCVPADLGALVVSEGQTVRVSEVKEDSKNKEKALGGTASGSLSPADGQEAKAAYRIFSKGAHRGNPAAMVNLAVSSLAGWGTPPNAGAALYWLHEAAAHGYGPALYDLGILFFKGCGVRPDAAQAFHFFEMGAQAGSAAAQVNLAYFYDRGLGVKQDREAAAFWYRRAAESGEAQAQYNLADLYLQGEGVPKDESAAFGWFQKAALQGHSKAQIMTGSMLAAGRGTAKDLAGAYFWIFAASLQGDDSGLPTLRALEDQLMIAQIEEAKLRARSFLAEQESTTATAHVRTPGPVATATHFPK